MIASGSMNEFIIVPFKYEIILLYRTLDFFVSKIDMMYVGRDWWTGQKNGTRPQASPVVGFLKDRAWLGKISILK